MIKPGWKRIVCPVCHMPRRVGERIQETIRARKPDGKGLFINQANSTFIMFKLQTPPEMGFDLLADICDNCGVQYAYEAIPRT